MFDNVIWSAVGSVTIEALFCAEGGQLDYGIFTTFPILFLGLVGAVRKGSRGYLFRSGLGLVIPTAVVATIVIIVMSILWTPYLLPRYTMDYLWLMGIALFVGVGALYQREKVNARLTLIVGILSVFTVIVCAALFCTPYDSNFATDAGLKQEWVNGILKWNE